MILILAVLQQAYEPDAFKKHVEALASDAMKGRNNGTEEGEKAAQYVADRFKEIGLRPGGRDGWFHDWKTTRGASELRGRNVIGVLEGSDAKLKGEYVVVNAHHDGLGAKKDGTVFNGADDNASGVAMVIELARAMAKSPPKRSVLFVSFDAEEDGLVGSREFVESGLYDMKAIAADVCYDLIGGRFLPWEGDRVYVLGAESSSRLREHAKVEEKGLDVARLGIYVIEPMGPMLARSDYKNFRDKSVPFVFLSTATPWYYHTEWDDIERLDFPKTAKIAAFSEKLVRAIADDPEKPTWAEKPELELARDAKLMLTSVEKLLSSEEVKLTEGDREQLGKHVAALREVAEAKEPPKDARARLQRAMVTVFGIVGRQRPR
jgi:hypothetical protein